MEIEDLIQAAANSSLDELVVREAVRVTRLSVEELFDVITESIVERFVRGECTWEFGNSVMRSLFEFAVLEPGGEKLGDYAFDVFNAFDQGEYPHPGEPEELQGEVKTRDLLAAMFPELGLSDPGPRQHELLVSHQAATRTQAVLIASQMLAGELSPIVGARALRGLRASVGVEKEDKDFAVMALIDDETMALPVDEEIRVLWAPDALAAKDAEIARSEAWALAIGKKALRSIITRFQQTG
jgi:hypothetical protein